MSTGVKSYEIRFASIKVLGFAQFDLGKEFDQDAFPLIEFKTNIQFRVLEDVKRVACLISVILIIKETEEKFAESKVETQFDVNPFEEIIIKDESQENNFRILNPLSYNIANVSVSTLRGILHEKLKGTFAQNDIFPLLDLAPQFLGKQEEVVKAK